MSKGSYPDYITYIVGEIHTPQFSNSTAHPANMDVEMTGTMQDQQAHDPSGREELAREAEIIYAGDACVMTDIDAGQHLTQKLLNYGTLTDTRNLKIQRGKYA